MSVITGNVIRALQRIKLDPRAVDMLVDEEYKEELLKVLQPCRKDESETFNLEEEFASQYRLVKAAIQQMGDIQTEEDLKILKEAKSYLLFIMKQEEKLADIKAVAAFKEAVLDALDEASPELRDKVINELKKSLS